jgi:hypothetical protein
MKDRDRLSDNSKSNYNHMKKQKPEKPLAEEWALSEGMGIIPDNIPFTQNIGCVGGKVKKPTTEKPKSKNKS